MCAKLHLIKCFGEPYDSFYLLPQKRSPPLPIERLRWGLLYQKWEGLYPRGDLFTRSRDGFICYKIDFSLSGGSVLLDECGALYLK
jgi:hypothetical protein